MRARDSYCTEIKGQNIPLPLFFCVETALHLKAHYHPGGFAAVCFCFEKALLFYGAT